ncbi:MAG: response regulator [Phycisphaerales bacterium]|nr:response regulator [Phycisphaerales bacterium]
MTDPSPTVLIVEDERAIRRFLRPALEGEGYRVLEADDQRSGLGMASSHTPDLIILDLGLPDRDGLELIRAVREWSSMPIIIVSARGQDADKVKALDLGADDYLTKPFSVQELLARVRAALRRSAAVRDAADGSPVFAVGSLTIDLAKRRVTLAAEPVTLTPLEFKLLAELAKHPGRVLTHKALLDAVWGPSRSKEPHLVRVHMANLRRKLEADTTRPRYLLTEPTVGYRLADA